MRTEAELEASTESFSFLLLWEGGNGKLIFFLLSFLLLPASVESTFFSFFWSEHIEGGGESVYIFRLQFRPLSIASLAN